MNDYATKVAEGFSTKVIELFFDKSFAMDVTNQDYEGEVKDKLTKLNILTFGSIAWENYTGADMTADEPQESVGLLETDVEKSYYFKILSIDQLHSWIKNPEGNLVGNTAKGLAKLIDTYICTFYTDVAAGNRIGTDADDATTITITTQTGAFVVAGGTPVASTWVGRGIKAVGHDKWYRVKSVSSTTEGVVEDDEDDQVASKTYPYDGGAITGASYVVEAISKLQVSKTTIYDYIVDMGTKLDGDGTVDGVPDDGERYLLLPGKIAGLLKKADTLIMNPGMDNSDIVRRGYIGDVDGFHVIKTNRVAGNNTTGYHCLGMHKSFITFAMAMTKSEIEQTITGNFGKAYKGLAVYGGKVLDERRKAGVEGFFYV